MPQSIPSVMIDAGFTQVCVHLTLTLVLHLALKYTSDKSDYLKYYQNLDKIFSRLFFFFSFYCYQNNYPTRKIRGELVFTAEVLMIRILFLMLLYAIIPTYTP